MNLNENKMCGILILTTNRKKLANYKYTDQYLIIYTWHIIESN